MSVILEDEESEAIQRVDDPKGAFMAALPAMDDHRFCILRFVDPYGDTILNVHQAAEAVREFDILLAELPQGESSEVIGRMREMAIECARGVHLYLRFEGD